MTFVVCLSWHFLLCIYALSSKLHNYICIGIKFPFTSGFNCSEAAKLLKQRYDTLSHLSCHAIVPMLNAYRVITLVEKKEIDQLMLDRQKMQKVLDIVIDSLNAGLTSKYKNFLKTMEESEDSFMNEGARLLGKLISTHVSSYCLIHTYSTTQRQYCTHFKYLSMTPGLYVVITFLKGI